GPVVGGVPGSGTPSLSSSVSQTSPCESPSLLAWSGFAVVGQLSPAWVETPSPSGSGQPSAATFVPVGVPAQLSRASTTPSLSSSGSQASPRVSPSVSSWSAFGSVGQLSPVEVEWPSPSGSGQPFAA